MKKIKILHRDIISLSAVMLLLKYEKDVNHKDCALELESLEKIREYLLQELAKDKQ